MSIKTITPSRKNIFVDLDETLIHTLLPFEHIDGKDYKPEYPVVKIKVGKDVYETCLRPGANTLLLKLREAGHVYMLTRAAKDYAKAMSKEFGFAFTEDRIFDREYVKNWKYKNVDIPNGKNYLIDDLNTYNNYEKIAFIKKFGPAEYIQVMPFYAVKGHEFTPDIINSIIETINGE